MLGTMRAGRLLHRALQHVRAAECTSVLAVVTVSALLDAGADPNVRDLAGFRTALHVPCKGSLGGTRPPGVTSWRRKTRTPTRAITAGFGPRSTSRCAVMTSATVRTLCGALGADPGSSGTVPATRPIRSTCERWGTGNILRPGQLPRSWPPALRPGRTIQAAVGTILPPCGTALGQSRRLGAVTRRLPPFSWKPGRMCMYATTATNTRRSTMPPGAVRTEEMVRALAGSRCGPQRVGDGIQRGLSVGAGPRCTSLRHTTRTRRSSPPCWRPARILNALGGAWPAANLQTHVAATPRGRESEPCRRLRALLEAGADVNAPFAEWPDATPRGGRLALRNPAVIEVLVAAGGDVNARDNNGYTHPCTRPPGTTTARRSWPR